MMITFLSCVVVAAIQPNGHTANWAAYFVLLLISYLDVVLLSIRLDRRDRE